MSTTVPLDRLIAVSISADRMSVMLALSPHDGRIPPAAEICERAAHLATARGVTAPIDRRAISNAIAIWSKRAARLDVVIAHGKPPVAGGDAQVHLRRPRPKEAQGADAADRVGKRNQGHVSNVEVGAVLATVTPPTTGTPGLTVSGDVVPPPPGRLAEIQIGPLVGMETVDGVIVYRALETAILVALSPTRIDIARSIDIQGNVDHETGNLDVWGSVNIRGSVIDGFSVRARGDVTIGGACESAYIESGGHVTVAGGILGKSGVTKVKCKGNCSARFVENAIVEAGGTMAVRDFVLQSRIVATGGIDVTGRGTVLSSTLAAERTVVVTSIGSDARLPVEIIVGNHPWEWRMLARLERDLRFARRATLAGADRAHGSDDRRARARADRKASRRRAAEVIETTMQRKQRAMMASLMVDGGPQVKVRKDVFPRTRIRLGPHVLDVERPLHGGVFRIDAEHGTIVWEPDRDR